MYLGGITLNFGVTFGQTVIIYITHTYINGLHNIIIKVMDNNYYQTRVKRYIKK